MKTTDYRTAVLVAAFGAAALLAACSRNTPVHETTTSRPDSAAAAESTAAATQLSYEERQGKALYTKYCAVCHADEGKGDGFNAYNLNPKPRDFTDARTMNAISDERLLQTIAGGGRSVNRSPLMPSWGGRMNPRELRYVAAYVRVFSRH